MNDAVIALAAPAYPPFNPESTVAIDAKSKPSVAKPIGRCLQAVIDYLILIATSFLKMKKNPIPDQE